MIRKFFAAALPAATALAFASPSFGGTLFVDANLVTGLNDGSSWANAFQGSAGLQTALSASMPGDEIYVADGTYLPTTSGRAASFNLRSGVEIFGSFMGGEASPEERPPFGTAPSILSGDLNGDDGAGNLTENSFHPLRGAGADETAVLDGFVVTGGNADGAGNNDRGGGILCRNGADPTIRNCHFIGNRCVFGGGAGYINNASPSFTDCIFEDNMGGSFGGAFDIATASDVVFNRCVFVRNRAARAGALEVFATNGVVVANSLFVGNTATAGGGGGAIWTGSGGNTLIVNCTVFGNMANNQAAGGLRNSAAAPVVRNSIFWGNIGSGGAQGSANQITAGVDVTHTVVEGGFAGTGNLAADPGFADSASEDFSLTLASPAIDAGDNSVVPMFSDFDLAGMSRFVDEPDVADTGVGTSPIVDMGAYESAVVVTENFCVVSPNSAGPGATLSSAGSTSVTANAFSLTAGGVIPGEFGLFYYGSASLQSPFGDGVRCVGGAGGGVFRLNPLVQADAAGVATRSVDLTLPPTNSGAGMVSPGSTWYFQFWFRDNVAGMSGFNTSDGLRVTFAP